MNPKTMSRPHNGFMPEIRSALLVFLTLFPMTLLHLFLHEGGHALVQSGRRRPAHRSLHPSLWLYRLFAAACRFLQHLVSPGRYHKCHHAVTGRFPGLLAVSQLDNPLPLLLFAAIAIREGLNMLVILMGTGDYQNISQLAGLPPGLFVATGLVLFLCGFVLFLSLIPRLGLAPENKQALWSIPAGFMLYGLASWGVGLWLIPQSPFLIQYDLVQEALSVLEMQMFVNLLPGSIIALVYVSVFRAFYQKLPAAWRVETMTSNWCALRWPAISAAISIVIGLVFIL